MAFRSLMFQGTGSSVGKSLLTAAFCRIFKDDGFDVVPFKAQNMSLNSFVTPEGSEIGRAQALQALAARVSPSFDMNPILIKPEADTQSQIVVKGSPWKTLAAGDYYTYREQLWDVVTSSLDRLKKEHELILIEGAGSPAEINFAETEIVNMSVARYLDSPVILVGNIDMGGVFAALIGTLSLLQPEQRQLIKGFIINKFRGDELLLRPGLDQLSELTEGRPVLGVVPFIHGLRLAEEDSVCLDEGYAPGNEGKTDIAVIHLPHMANFDDFDALALEAGVKIRFVRELSEVGSPDAVIIPGTKTTIDDLLWLKEMGFSEMLAYFRRLRIPIVGICGGYQMLGRSIKDPEGVEGPSREISGFGFFPFDTVFERGKITRKRAGVVRGKCGFFAQAGGFPVCGYEIHSGKTCIEEGTGIFAYSDGTMEGSSSEDGRLWGTYLHGVFDLPEFRRAWLSSLGMEFHGEGKSISDLREEELSRLSGIVRERVDMYRMREIVGV